MSARIRFSITVDLPLPVGPKIIVCSKASRGEILRDFGTAPRDFANERSVLSESGSLYQRGGCVRLGWILDTRREEGVSDATDNRYESQLRIAAYKAITDLLSKRDLITKEEERKIRKSINKMQDDLIGPASNPHTHDRDLTTM